MIPLIQPPPTDFEHTYTHALTTPDMDTTFDTIDYIDEPHDLGQQWTIKDKFVIYFIRWISCGWKQDYIIQKYRQRKMMHNYLHGGGELPLYVKAHLLKLKHMNLTEEQRKMITRRLLEQTLKNRFNFSELSDDDDGSGSGGDDGDGDDGDKAELAEMLEVELAEAVEEAEGSGDDDGDDGGDTAAEEEDVLNAMDYMDEGGWEDEDDDNGAG